MKFVCVFVACVMISFSLMSQVENFVAFYFLYLQCVIVIFVTYTGNTIIDVNVCHSIITWPKY